MEPTVCIHLESAPTQSWQSIHPSFLNNQHTAVLPYCKLTGAFSDWCSKGGGGGKEGKKTFQFYTLSFSTHLFLFSQSALASPAGENNQKKRHAAQMRPRPQGTDGKNLYEVAWRRGEGRTKRISFFFFFQPTSRK